MFDPKFIQATEEFNTFEKNVPAPYVRKSFFSETETSAKITVAVCGFYRLFFNGAEITKGFLAPYISNTDDYVYYDEYTVKLDEGENVVGVILGNGFQNNPGGHVWDFDKASFRSAPKLGLEIEYINASGATVKVCSDGSFRTHPSPILYDDYRFGEFYDANRETEGWNRKGFDDGGWKNALVLSQPKGELKLCTVEPIGKETELRPVKIFKEDEGFVYDFGVSYTGVCRLRVKGVKGQKIEMTHADVLKDGRFYIDNLWFMGRKESERDYKIVHKDVYVCKGGEEEIYVPSFVYHGFRYVKVTGITEEQATSGLLTYLVYHSALETRGNFFCSDETANKLQMATRRSDLSNFWYFPTDCPHREKNGWTADAALSSEHVTLNFAPEKSYTEWICNIRKAQAENGALPGIIPTGGWGFAWGNGPAWDSVLTYLPYFTYIYRGQTEMIKDSAEAFIKYLRYLETRKDEKGLMHIGLGDWCQVGDGETKSPLELTDTVMSMDIANKTAFMLDAVGMKSESEYAKGEALKYRKAIRDNLIDFESMTAAGNCQTSQAMCIFYNVFEECEKEKAFSVLLNYIREEDDHIMVGVLGGRVLFHVLSSFGYSDLAYKMITRPDFPSYGNWIERGATTLWEDFHKDRVYSPNHHFWGDISAWFIKSVAGIKYNPTGKDLTELEISPAFIGKLEYAGAYYDSVYGKIDVSWKRDGEAVILKVSVPDALKGKIKADKGFGFENGAAEIALSSGEFILKRKVQ